MESKLLDINNLLLRYYEEVKNFWIKKEILWSFHQKFHDITGYSILDLQDELIEIKNTETEIDKWEIEIRNELKLSTPKIENIEIKNEQI